MKRVSKVCESASNIHDAVDAIHTAIHTGAKKGEIRRIIVPSNLGYSETTDLEPIPPTTEDKRALDSVLRNPRRDAALLFDVKILRVK